MILIDIFLNLNEHIMEKITWFTVLTWLWDFTKTVILPAALFFAGLYFAQLLKNKEHKKDQAELRTYFETIVDLECKITDKQVLEYNECINRLNELDTKKDVGISTVFGLPIDAYNSIDKKELFFAYNVKGNKNLPIYFSTIITHFTYINDTYLKMQSNVDGFVNNISPFISEFNERSVKFHDIIKNNFSASSNIKGTNLEKDVFLNKMLIIRDQYRKFQLSNKNSTLKDTNDEFILKLNKLVEESNDPRIKLFKDELLLWTHCYNQIEFFYEIQKKYLESTAINLEKASKGLRSNLFNLQTKPVFHWQAN